MNTISKSLIVLVCVTSQMAMAADTPSVSELLDRYAANQDKLSSFIAKTEQTNSGRLLNRDEPLLSRLVTEARVDGERTHMFFHEWRELPTRDAPTPMAEGQHSITLWDGERAIGWSNRGAESEPGRGVIIRDKNHAKHATNVNYTGVPLMGVRFSEYDRIDSVLRRATTISLRKTPEQIGSSTCCVIDAKAASGTYTVWLDPQHGYQVAQAEISLGPNDNYRGRILQEDEREFVSITNVRFRNIDGIWIPMEADIHRELNKPHLDWHFISDRRVRITEITLNPDHEALGSFVPVVANGTILWDRDFGIKYTWQDGQLIPEIDDL